MTLSIDFSPTPTGIEGQLFAPNPPHAETLLSVATGSDWETVFRELRTLGERWAKAAGVKRCEVILRKRAAA